MQLKQYYFSVLVLGLGTLLPLSSTCNTVGCLNSECIGNGGCKYGCILGYEGSACDTCIQGYFPQGNYCIKCYLNCLCTSSSDLNCTSCTVGYHGQWCTTFCPSGCLEDKCFKNDGKCSIGCKANHYGEYCNPCSSGCYNNQCYGNGVCTYNCINGYIGDKCDSCQPGWFISNEICKQCRDTCESCTSYDTCSFCVSGYHGTDCTSICSEGCSNNICNKYNGQCTSGCSTGYYGSMCTVCSNGCEDTCDSSNGNCSCKPGHSGNQCTNCLSGWYLVNNVCNQCTNNCMSCQSPTQCYSCNQGFYGSACENTCPHGCLTGCYKDQGICYSCREGYSGDKCCVQSQNCKICSSNTTCSHCTPGFYGTNCEQSCPTNCYSECSKDSGHCISCKDGFYGYVCTETCLDNCIACSANGQCSTCKDGFYGQTCNSTCPQNCLSCDNNGYCNYKCKDGYYGSKCESKCPDNCEVCSSVNSCSKCKHGFTSTYSCYNLCNSRCRSCLVSNSYQCTECFRGKYFSNCYIDCPKFCKHGFCDIDGQCIDGCVEGFTGSYCCPEKCGSCDSKTGKCYSGYCQTGYSEQYCNCGTIGCTDQPCTSCTNNTWYISGNKCCKCSSACKNQVCNNDMTCVEGCIEGFYGDLCDERCMDKDINCLLCDADKCTKCISGFFPDQSGMCVRCYVNCLNGNCSSINGTCLEGCREEYWGRNCSNKCPNSCQFFNSSSSCDANTGECSFGCSSNKHGKSCDKNCSITCIDNECEWETGFCTKGCIADYHGQLCEASCNTNCVSGSDGSTCDDNTGTCSIGCKNGFYGERCQSICGNNFANVTCSRSNGECVYGCTDGFEGSVCVQAIDKSTSSGNTAPFVAGVSAGVGACLVISAVVLVIYILTKRRKRNQKKDQDLSSIKNQPSIGTDLALSNIAEADNHYEELGADRGSSLDAYQSLNIENTDRDRSRENPYLNLQVI